MGKQKSKQLNFQKFTKINSKGEAKMKLKEKKAILIEAKKKVEFKPLERRKNGIQRTEKIKLKKSNKKTRIKNPSRLNTRLQFSQALFGPNCDLDLGENPSLTEIIILAQKMGWKLGVAAETYVKRNFPTYNLQEEYGNEWEIRIINIEAVGTESSYPTIVVYFLYREKKS